MPVPPPAMTPAILGNYEENGRLYGGFRKGKYMFPMDEVNYTFAAGCRIGLTETVHSQRWIAWISITSSFLLRDEKPCIRRPSYRITTVGHEYWIWELAQEFGRLTWQSKQDDSA